MGGATITKVGNNIGDLLIQIKEQIEAGNKAGLVPDGDVFVMNPSTEVGFILEPIFYGLYLKQVAFVPVKSGDIEMAVCVSKHLGPTPAKGDWIAGVHLHS